MSNNEPHEKSTQNNVRFYKGPKYHLNNIKIPRRKNIIKSDNNNTYQEIAEFNSQEELIFLKKLKPTKSFEPLIKNQKTKGQSLLYDSNNNLINSKTKIINEYNKKNEYSINKGITKPNNKSNSSVRINTKINCKKYFISQKLGDYNTENMPNQINNNKKVVKSNSNNYNIVYPGQNTVKMTGKKKVNYYNNRNNNLTMTKSSIHIKGIYPLTQSQNINYQYRTQLRVESIALNVGVNNSNSSQGKYNRRQNVENSNNKARSIQRRYINNQNYNNKTHLVKRELNNKMINYDNNNNNLTPKLIQNKNIKFYRNSNLIENLESGTNKEKNRYNNNYNYQISNSNRAKQTINKIKKNLAISTQVEMENENQFVKNNKDQYNNIFFYTSNTNTTENNNSNIDNEKNKNKYKFQNRKKNDFIFNAMDYDIDNNNYNVNNINSKNENKMKNKCIYKKTGDLNENKTQKFISNINNSQIKINDNNNKDIQNSEKLHKNLTKEKKQNSKINKNIKRDKSNEIIPFKSKRIYRQIKDTKFQNYNIKKHKMKIRKKKSFNIIDLKIKIPPNDKEEIITINIKKDNITERIENIIKDYCLDESYYDPLLSLVNNSINILKNIDNMNIYKSVKNDNQKLYTENEEVTFLEETSSRVYNLDFSLINQLIENNKYKEYIENLYSDNEEIIDNAKILNMSI